MEFPQVNYDYIETKGLLTAFRDSVIERIIDVSGISLGRMKKIKLYKGSVIFRFNLLPPKSFHDGMLEIGC